MPTRTGYSFVGWRGKNLVKISDFLATSENHHGITAASDFSDGSITLNGYKERTGSDTFIYDMVSILKIGVTYYFYEKEPQDEYRVQCMFVVHFADDEDHYYLGEYTPVGSEKYIGLYIEGFPYRTYENRKVYPMLEEGQQTQYEPYYIESDTIFGTPGDRTLTAMWSQNNILTGGALQTESDLANFRQSNAHDGSEQGYDYGVASIVTEDNYSCAKIVGEQHRAKQIFQSVLGKLEVKKMYSITARIKLVNMIKHENSTTDYYFDPRILIYSSGYVGSTWLRVMNNFNLSEYNNQGWVDVRFVGLSCPDAADDFDISQATSISFAIFIANYSGTLYIRDFAIAKM